MQTLLRHGNVPARERRLAVAGVGFGALGQRVVASGMQPSRSRGYVQEMVREAGAGQPSQPACGVERRRKPPDTMSTSGGVRGGDREEPSYSILPLEQVLIWAPAPACAGAAPRNYSAG